MTVFRNLRLRLLTRRDRSRGFHEDAPALKRSVLAVVLTLAALAAILGALGGFAGVMLAPAWFSSTKAQFWFGIGCAAGGIAVPLLIRLLPKPKPEPAETPRLP